MVSILERFKTQKRELVKAEANSEDEAMAAALAGKTLTAEQLSCLDDEKIALAERRAKEGLKIRDGEAATTQLPAALQAVEKHRQALQTAIQQANAKHGPLIRDAQRVVQGLTEREAQGRLALTWLIEGSPVHVAAPLLFYRKRLVREQQYADRNLRALNRVKADLEAAKGGTLQFPSGLEMNSGSRGAVGDNAVKKARDRQYSNDAIGSLKAERDRLRDVSDECQKRVADLQRKVSRLETLQREAWPTRAAVTAILGQQWDPEEAAKQAFPEVINPGYGTPSEARFA